MQPMPDEPNDMWAAATVLFQLLMAGDSAWQKEFGPFMFGPLPQECLESLQLVSGQDKREFQRGAVDRRHKLWVRSLVADC